MRFDSNKNGIRTVEKINVDNKHKNNDCRHPNTAKFKPDSNLKLLDQVRQVMRYFHYAFRTEQAYCKWIVKYIEFHNCNSHL